ncbi:tRNA synthetase class I (I, L, M and V) family protein [Artemisia annua]|uniref:tRNA synthetase class I (I, L, M and V) family protein n=1 Tax=Artemisia annua TaxID=35608 RepID=A0A2U1MK88_ARTAN|nr:tRNA synthetase class I (I, L, M and V) family protein [Artemisia annua]
MEPLPSYGHGRDGPGGRFSSLIGGSHLIDVLITVISLPNQIVRRVAETLPWPNEGLRFGLKFDKLLYICVVPFPTHYLTIPPLFSDHVLLTSRLFTFVYAKVPQSPTPTAGRAPKTEKSDGEIRSKSLANTSTDNFLNGTGKLIASNLEAEVYLHSSDDNIALRLRIMCEAKSDVDSPNRIFLTSQEAGCLAKARKLGTLCSRQCLKYNFEYVDFLSVLLTSRLFTFVYAKVPQSPTPTAGRVPKTEKVMVKSEANLWVGHLKLSMFLYVHASVGNYCNTVEDLN